MASGSATLFPYMNQRDYPVVGTGMLIVQYSGSITFRWGVEQAGTSKPVFHVITAYGPWGSQTANHFPILAITDATPGSPVSYPDKASMQADLDAYTAIPYTSLVDTAATYAIVGNEYYVLVQGDTGKAWAPVRPRTAAGTATIAGVLCDVYTATIPVSEVPEYNGETMSPSEVFSLCWSGNGRHRDEGWDAEFGLTGIFAVGQFIDHCPLCGIRMRVPRPYREWPNGKPKCIMSDD